MKTFRTIGLALALSLNPACWTAGLTPDQKECRAELRTVILHDGVSRTEAEIIARSYFSHYVVCGGLMGIEDGGDRWIVDGRYGYAGEPRDGFYIDKRSGRLNSPVGRSYENPLRIFD